MRGKRIYFILTALGIAAGLFVARRIWIDYQVRTSIKSHLEGENMTRLRALHLCIDSAALTEPATFMKVCGNGWTGVASTLPVEITGNFPFGTNVSQYYLDVWGKPFRVKIARGKDTVSTATFETLLWSTGRNGVDEERAGDDEFVKWKALDVPLEPATSGDRKP